LPFFPDLGTTDPGPHCWDRLLEWEKMDEIAQLASAGLANVLAAVVLLFLLFSSQLGRRGILQYPLQTSVGPAKSRSIRHGASELRKRGGTASDVIDFWHAC
jgi:hypothetical protein